MLDDQYIKMEDQWHAEIKKHFDESCLPTRECVPELHAKERYDANQTLARSSALAKPSVKASEDQSFDELDLNGDGVIDRNEWEQAQNAHDHENLAHSQSPIGSELTVAS